MLPLRCLLIEDEIPAIELLKMYIERISDELVVAHACHSANEAHRILATDKIDLIFLDMELSGRMNGLDFLQFTEENPSRPPVIVTTGKKEYLPESFEYHVKAYLFKPFSFEMFYKKVKEIIQVISEKKQSSTLPSASETSTFIFIKTTEKGHSITKKLEFSKLKYVEARDKQAHYHTEEGHKWSVWDSLDSISKDILPHGTCCRAHDKWLIGSKRFIQEAHWTDDYLLMIDGTKIPIGQTYKAHLKKYLTEI